MASVNLELPFEAYRGDEPYIFVSYAHKDSEKVYPLLSELREMGYRVWYDEGIDPGNEWPEDIANALLKCSHFLVFLTCTAVDRKNVRKEINFAINEDKPFLAVHLEEIKLLPGLALQMGDIQAVMKWRLSSDHYQRALRRALPDTLREKIVSPSKPEPTAPHPAPAMTRKAGDIETVDLGKGVKLELVWCPAGSFWMGSPANEAERDDYETRHRVALTNGFWLGKYEVIQEQWEAVMGTNPSEFKGASNLPVENVSWVDCQEFCEKLNAKMPGDVGGFRLPTEAEWEYACRAGTETAFCYGNSLDATMANFKGTCPYGGAAEGKWRWKTVLVGSFRPNGWGLYDMHGNVWEWCSDWNGAYPSVDAIDPTGAASGAYRVVRGGGWFNFARFCRSAHRSNYTPSIRLSDLGFRVARTLP